MNGIKIKKDAFFWLGCLMVLILVADIVANLGDWTELFWFCPVTAALVAFACFRRSALVMTACLVLVVPAQVPWVNDFALYLLGKSAGGRTAMLSECGPVIFWGSMIIHTAVIPVAAWGVWKLGFHPRALWLAVIYGALLLTASYLFTPSFKNVNCVFFGCDVEDPGKGYLAYFLTRSLLLWAFIVPTSYLVLSWVYRGRKYGKLQDANNA